MCLNEQKSTMKGIKGIMGSGKQQSHDDDTMMTASVTPYVSASAPVDHSHVDEEMGRFLRLDKLRKRTTAHKTFIVLNVVVIVTAVHLAAGQTLGLVIQKSNYPMEVVMRVFTIGHAVLIVMNECELTRFTKESLILRNFLTRGLFYAFVGCVGNVENDIGSNNMYNNSWNSRYDRYNSMEHTVESFAEVYIMIISWLTIFLGLLYVIMGIFCLNHFLDKTRADYQNRMEEYKREGGIDEGKGAGCINMGELV